METFANDPSQQQRRRYCLVDFFSGAGQACVSRLSPLNDGCYCAFLRVFFFLAYHYHRRAIGNIEENCATSSATFLTRSGYVQVVCAEDNLPRITTTLTKFRLSGQRGSVDFV